MVFYDDKGYRVTISRFCSSCLALVIFLHQLTVLHYFWPHANIQSLQFYRYCLCVCSYIPYMQMDTSVHVNKVCCLHTHDIMFRTLFIIITVTPSEFFNSPTDAQVNCHKNNFKIYIKIDINTALTHICSHITTHPCILIGCFYNCNFRKHQ